MRLAQALRCDEPVRLALVGAGGKSTALFRLAHELSTSVNNQAAKRLVLVSASTHLGEEQCRFADFHFPVSDINELQALEPHLPDGVVLLTGNRRESGRISGLDQPLLDRLYDLSEKRKCSLLIEADGSRLRPLKAPAAHEPALPQWVDTVVVCAGLSGLGKPLNPEWVHRPEIFTQISGLSLDEPITPAALCSVLLHPQAGLKSIPEKARRLVLLNQADTLELQSIASGMVASLLDKYHAVLIAALAPPGTGPDSRVGGDIFAVHERVAGIVLAAGGSTRLGQPKQLLPWQGEPIVRHVAKTGLAAGLQPVIVVTGAAASAVEEALVDLPIQIVRNPDWEAGQSTSVKVGLQRVPAESGAVVFLLADQPRVSKELLSSLVELHATTFAPLVAPEVQGQRGNPVLFDRQTFPALFALEGDVGGRPLFSRFKAARLPWHDSSILLDIDSPEDYQQLLEG